MPRSWAGRGIKFNLRKFSWIGKAASDARVIYVGAKTPFKTFDDLLKGKEIILASSGVGTSDYAEGLMLGSAFGIHIKEITGYAGKEAELAIIRGEVDGKVQSFSSIEYYINSGQGRVLLQIAAHKHPQLLDIPLASDIVPAQGKKLIKLMEATSSSLQRLTAAPPGLPAGRLQVLTEAYRKALTDPGLLAEAQKAQVPIDPLFGQDVARAVEEALDQPPENVALLKKILRKGSK